LKFSIVTIVKVTTILTQGGKIGSYDNDKSQNLVWDTNLGNIRNIRSCLLTYLDIISTYIHSSECLLNANCVSFEIPLFV